MFLLISYPVEILKLFLPALLTVYFVQPSRAEGRIRIRTYNNGSGYIIMDPANR
jgi:hypothetical protein